MQEKINDAEKLTENNTALTLNIAANYGGCWDIIAGSLKTLAGQVKENKLAVSEITEVLFQRYLVTRSTAGGFIDPNQRRAGG